MIPSKKTDVPNVPVLNLNKLAIKEPGVIENHMDDGFASSSPENATITKPVINEQGSSTKPESM